MCLFGSCALGFLIKQIPLQAKIVSVADTFDAMTIDRPYQKGMGLEQALDVIKSFVGSRYDLKVVDALIRALYALASGWDMAGKPPVKLRNGCLHRLQVGADGALTPEALNLPLLPVRMGSHSARGRP